VISQRQIAEWPRARFERHCRFHAQVAYLGEKTVLARILGKHKIYLRSTDLGFASHVMLDGYWESWLTQFLARRLRPGMTAIDVGANFGYYSLFFADAVGPSGRVLAVEPVPDTASLLTDSLELNGFWANATVCRIALGATVDSMGQMLVPRREPKNAAVVRDNSVPASDTIAVPVTTIDALAKDLDRIDLIKIDADGSEEAIVAGMRDTISRHHPALVLEYNAARCNDPEQVVQTLLSAYGRARFIDYDAELVEIGKDALCDKAYLEDRLLYFN
jgi:FkbM family methyltransferase